MNMDTNMGTNTDKKNLVKYSEEDNIYLLLDERFIAHVMSIVAHIDALAHKAPDSDFMHKFSFTTSYYDADSDSTRPTRLFITSVYFAGGTLCVDLYKPMMKPIVLVINIDMVGASTKDHKGRVLDNEEYVVLSVSNFALSDSKVEFRASADEVYQALKAKVNLNPEDQGIKNILQKDFVAVSIAVFYATWYNIRKCISGGLARRTPESVLSFFSSEAERSARIQVEPRVSLWW